MCDEYQKEAKLARLLEEIGCQQGSKIIIFVETKRKADELTRLVKILEVIYRKNCVLAAACRVPDPH